MWVYKRDGQKETVQFDKITARLTRLCYGLNPQVDSTLVAQKVIEGLYEGVKTSELDRLACEIAASLAASHHDYGLLAARIAVSNMHKCTLKSFSQNIVRLYQHVDKATGRAAPLVSKEIYEIALQESERLDSMIVYDRDFAFDYFGYKTLERSYLLKIEGQVAERPQQMFMRVALGIHGYQIDRVLETYELMSQRYFTHGTPTLFNAGTPKAQMSSCFLLTLKEDSIEGIFESLKQCAKISQMAGGIGFSLHHIRASGSYIRGTGGISNGIIPMLRVFNDTARYVDQGGGKRKGSFAAYLEPWHADIFAFLDLRKNTGKEELRTRDLFTALWVPDLFMKRIEENGTWSLFCPSEAPGLDDCWGKVFEEKYLQYESQGLARRVVKAQDLWLKILEAQIETGTPYILFKDACNQKSNQRHLGTIKSSNLCAEIVEYCSADEIAVCNLASIALPRFASQSDFDHQKLFDVTQVAVRNLNSIIERNVYPLEEARKSNFRHRPIGLGVQGLADLFMQMRLPFESEQAAELNKEIFETLAFAALSCSCDIAKELGTYESYEGSPLSQGLFQHDLWGVTPSTRWDWEQLRARIKKYGLRNSLLIALMPTASTSQILGNTESIEPLTSNLYTRRVLSGEFIVVNRHLIEDLSRLGLWNEKTKQKILQANGSIQLIDEIPSTIKELYKTVWEIKQKTLIDMAADRGAFICQSQSLNLYLEKPTVSRLSAMHLYSWKKGLKTGIYYLRTKAAAQPIKFTVEATSPLQASCFLEPGCQSCSG